MTQQPMTTKRDRRKREAFAVLTYSNMLTLNALVQLLIEKGIITGKELLERVKSFEDRGRTRKLPL